ncbi:carbon monoxide dehydrogenase [Emticicia aquatilis]|uniref:Carbon monoxide dehydrogenase n=1 Tax=Emticicia aquatilis TaxID=1537369 RepID=A0A916YWT5_9BACT|nr:xanthine dehydrogenase family protein subunit M [Emticicia aquatilis]GGD65027.1 carbon monoxide dehydrogenase [Emticicia aquatilis]
MLPNTVDYYRASSVSDALSVLKANPDAKILAGGHSLIPAMKLRLNSPSMVIDIANLSDLNYIKEEGGNICIGAMTTHGQIAHSSLLAEKLPLFTETADVIGDVQVRNMGTIGGSIAHADPSADWPAALLAADASIVVTNGDDTRSISAVDFFVGFFSTALEEGEIITEIQVPVPAAGTKMTYQKFMQPASRFAIVGCAAMAKVENGVVADVKVAFTGVSDGPFRDGNVEAAISGKTATAENIASAAAQAASDVSLNADHYADEDYRQHLARVYAKRALTAVCR